MSYNKETGLYEGFIYKIYNDVNDKVYIGQTAIDIESRWIQHLSKTAYREDNSIVHKAIEKYGKEHFNIEAVDTIYNDNFESLRKELNKREISCIEQYNSISPNGYNILYGGGDVPIKRIKIYQFDLCGNFIQEFDSISDALRYLNKSNKNSTIQKHIGKDNYAFGFLWSYDKNINPHDLYIKNRKQRKIRSKDNNKLKKPRIPVNQYELDDGFIQSYINTTIASKEIGINNSGNIVHCCKHRIHTAYGYKWFYANDPTQPDKTKIIN